MNQNFHKQFWSGLEGGGSFWLLFPVCFMSSLNIVEIFLFMASLSECSPPSCRAGGGGGVGGHMYGPVIEVDDKHQMHP